MQVVLKGQGEGLGRPHLPFHSNLLSILYPVRCPHNLPQVSTPTLKASVWLMANSATTAVTKTTTPPCVNETNDFIAPPVTAEPDWPDDEARCPQPYQILLDLPTIVNPSPA